jgi:hypothetical protein
LTACYRRTRRKAVIGDADNRTDLVNRIQSVTGGATATLQEVWTVATNTQGALALV